MYYIISYYIIWHLSFLFTISNSKANMSEAKQPPAQATLHDGAAEKAFAKKLCHSLQANDVKEWLALFPTAAEYRLLMQKATAAKLDGLTAEKAEAMIAEREKEATLAYTNDFETLRQQAKTAGLNWRKCVYDDFLFDVDETVAGGHYINGDAWLKVGKTAFMIEGIEAVETTGGYRLQSVADVKMLDNEE